MPLNTEMRVNRITDEVWEISATEKSGMVVPARIYATQGILQSMDRGAFAQVFDRSAEELGMELVYDVAHNIAKVERYPEGYLLVHRKGAIRAFGPGSPDVPRDFQKIGQPVICGGSMETGSNVLVGTDRAVRETFGSTMHGAGRTMSRA